MNLSISMFTIFRIQFFYDVDINVFQLLEISILYIIESAGKMEKHIKGSGERME